MKPVFRKCLAFTSRLYQVAQIRRHGGLSPLVLFPLPYKIAPVRFPQKRLFKINTKNQTGNGNLPDNG
ncbi:MAG: hypothetical protein LBH00_03000, partial [Planctomycetaceae bacterium]|nr:hypothetical protein [Planctomycetaceae bacterium]